MSIDYEERLYFYSNAGQMLHGLYFKPNEEWQEVWKLIFYERGKKVGELRAINKVGKYCIERKWPKVLGELWELLNEPR